MFIGPRDSTAIVKERKMLTLQWPVIRAVLVSKALHITSSAVLQQMSAGTDSCCHDRRQKCLKSFIPAQPKTSMLQYYYYCYYYYYCCYCYYQCPYFCPMSSHGLVIRAVNLAVEV